MWCRNWWIIECCTTAGTWTLAFCVVSCTLSFIMCTHMYILYENVYNVTYDANVSCMSALQPLNCCYLHITSLHTDLQYMSVHHQFLKTFLPVCSLFCTYLQCGLDPCRLMQHVASKHWYRSSRLQCWLIKVQQNSLVCKHSFFLFILVILKH